MHRGSEIYLIAMDKDEAGHIQKKCEAATLSGSIK